jgi:hypothetical protein
MGVFSGLSDDQIAVIYCCAALFASATLMSLSYYIGQYRKRSDSADSHIPFTTAVPRQGPITDRDQVGHDSDRRAA